MPDRTLEVVYQAILSDPWDDVPRLAYADLLEERGAAGDDLVTEFIRLSLEKEASGHVCRFFSLEDPNPTCDVWPCPHLKRLRETLPLYDHFWKSSRWFWKSHLIGNCSTSYFDSRGFIGKVTCRLSDWKRYGKRLVRQFPLTDVEITDKEPGASDDGSSLSFPPVYWRHCCNVSALRSHWLPTWLWKHRGGSGVRDYFEDLKSAREYLSTLCLEWARG